MNEINNQNNTSNLKGFFIDVKKILLLEVILAFFTIHFFFVYFGLDAVGPDIGFKITFISELALIIWGLILSIINFKKGIAIVGKINYIISYILLAIAMFILIIFVIFMLLKYKLILNY